MGRLIIEPDSGATAIEYGLPWSTIVRGQRWGVAPDRVLLVHAPGTDIDAWGALPARLAQTLLIGVTGFDLPGHGLSDDPWEPSRVGDVIRALVGRVELPYRQVLITAGLTASAALDVAADFRHVALVCLSPETSPAATAPPHSPETPKLFFASSLVNAELDNARRLASRSGGWSNVTSVPVEESRTTLLASHWGEQIEEGIVSFTRDFLALRAPSRRLARPEENAKNLSASD